ncbi:MAG: hypothetical protein ACI9MC_002121 [Kiritimatiellia bacterium]|jgi:hypothetical protein
MANNRWPVLGAAVVIMGLGTAAATGLQWQWNMLELEPEGLRSIELQRELVDRFRMSSQTAQVTVPTVSATRALRKELRAMGVVGAVDDISSWVSRPDFAEAQVHVQALRRSLAQPATPLSMAAQDATEIPDSSVDNTDPWAALSVAERRAALADELDRLWANIVEMQALAFTGGQDRVVEKSEQLIGSRETRDTAPLRRLAVRYTQDDVPWTQVDTFAQRFEAELRPLATRMAASSSPVGVEQLPPSVLALYVSDEVDGYLMRIMPRHDVWTPDNLHRFQDSVSQAHPGITGMPLMILRMNVATQTEGALAFGASLAVILVILLIDFRRPLVAVLAFLPLIGGLTVLLGSMYLLDVRLHYLNVIALPVIVGIGVDSGVHLLHRLIADGPDNMERAMASVGRAILMSSLTTMISFGSLMFFMMRGMADLGLVLFIGMAASLLITLTVLPAAASVLLRPSKQRATEAQHV